MMDSNRLALMIMGPFSLMIGAGTIFWTAKRVWYFWRSRGWLRATGIVTRSEALEDPDGDGTVWFVPHVEYSFEAAGLSFLGKARMFGFPEERFATRAEAEELANMYPVGAAVRVLYHPARPGECVLMRKLHVGVPVVGLVGGIGFTVCGIWMLVEAIG